MLARAMGITHVEDLPDRDHTVWEIKEPATAKQPTFLLLVQAPTNCQTFPHSHDCLASSRGYVLLQGQPVSGCGWA